MLVQQPAINESMFRVQAEAIESGQRQYLDDDQRQDLHKKPDQNVAVQLFTIFIL